MSEGPGGGELQALWGGAEPRGQVMLLPHLLPFFSPSYLTWALPPATETVALVQLALECQLPPGWEGKGLSHKTPSPSQEVSGEGEKQPDEQSLQLW